MATGRRTTRTMPHPADRGVRPRVLVIAGVSALALGALTACSAGGQAGAGGAAASGVPAGSKPAASECLIGSWTTTSQVYDSKSLGGAGQKYVFKADQTATLDYTGSGPVANPDGNGSIQYSGTSAWKISKFVSTSSTAGTFTFTLSGGTVTAVNGGQTSTLPSVAVVNWPGPAMPTRQL